MRPTVIVIEDEKDVSMSVRAMKAGAVEFLVEIVRMTDVLEIHGGVSTWNMS